MYNKRSYPVSRAFLLIFLILFSTSGSAYAAVLEWNTFLGGSGNEYGIGIAVDSSGNTYVCGRSTATWGSPVQPYTKGNDVSVSKLSDNGTLVWNTFLGDNGTDNSYGIAVDGSGNIYVVGHSTATWGSPVRAYTAGADAFVAKLDNNGTLVWNTFLGGSGTDYGYDLTIDNNTNIYVVGYSDATWGSPVRAYTAGIDAFVAKLDNNGTLVWNTFLGGNETDYGSYIAVSGDGNLYVGGSSYATWGSPVREYTADWDAYVAKLSSGGDLTWNTFLGGSGNDLGNGIIVDKNGNIYVSGYSDATWDSPVGSYTALNDASVAKLSSSGDLTWNTFFGGSGNDYGNAIAMDTGGNIFVTGESDATWGSPVREYTADRDAIVAQIADNGMLVWNTFLGGSLYDGGYGIAVSSDGNLHVTGESDATWGFPVRDFAASEDIHVTKILMPPPVQATNIVAANTEGTQADISWTRGSGEQCAVFMKQTDNGTAAPVDNSTYTANAAFGAGTQIGSTGWYSIYNGTGTGVTVTSLTPETTYRIMVCEYKGASGSELYNISTATGNPANLTTADNGTDNETCTLKVIPKKLHKLLSIVEPLKVFVLIGSKDTVFDKTDRPTWDSTAIKPLLKLKIGKRIVLSFVFVNPFALTPGEVGVTIGDCMGTIEVKAF